MADEKLGDLDIEKAEREALKPAKNSPPVYHWFTVKHKPVKVIEGRKALRETLKPDEQDANDT